MKRSLRMAMAAGGLALIAGSLPGKEGKGVLPRQTLSIHLQNDDVSVQTLRWATIETSRLFRAAAIDVTWQHLSDETARSRDIEQDNGVCPQMNEPRYITLRLMREAPATVSEDAIGVARPFAQTGTQISIFINRVELLARFVNTPLYVILGHAMAHEIGHVLLASSQHSSTGLMEAHWNTISLHLASEGLLAFGREEAERMNARLANFQSCGIKSEIAGNNWRAQ